MKKLLFISLMLCSSLAFSQNAVHYAFDTNGPMGECLFNQDSRGNVIYTGIVEMNGTAEEIIMAVSDFIESSKGLLECVAKQKVKTKKNVMYQIKCPVGKQYFSIEVWSSPVFSRLRDASEVIFDCNVEAIDGKFKYTLNNFVTKRNMLKGEAKNDGSPNIIHWQRVNSLIKERQNYLSRHNPAKRSTKEDLYDYDTQIDFEQSLYKMEHKKVMQFVEGLNNMKEQSSDTFTSDLVPADDGNDGIEPLNLDNYKGNLLKKGNCVYVMGGNPYESAGASELIKQISIDNLWKIVTDPRLAHFIIEYRVDLDGRDRAYLRISSRDGSRFFSGFKHSSDESVDGNRGVARSMYLNELYPLIKKLESGKTPKELVDFEIR